MGEDSGYFSRRSNEFRLPTQHSYSNILANTKLGCHCLQQRICCYCDPHSYNGSPRTYECYAEPSVCDHNDTTIPKITSTTDPQCSSSHYCHCDCSNSNYNNNNNQKNIINTNNINVRDRHCPYYCDHHYYHHHQPHNQAPIIKSPFTVCGPDSQSCTQQQQHKTWNDCDPHNNNPSDTISSPLSSELISHPSLVYPGSGLTATDSSIGSRSNSGNVCDNNTSASSVGYQQSSSSSSLVGRARFSPNDIIKLGYKDLLKHPALKRFSYGFQDEQEFEEFKQDLKDFQLSKREPKTVEDSLSPTQSSSGGYWSSSRRPYTRETSPDSDGGSVTSRNLIDNRGSHHHPHYYNQHHTPNRDRRSNLCKVENESCDHDYNDDRRGVKRNITFSSFNADKSGRIPGTDILENPYSTNYFSSANPSKFSPTFNKFSPLLEHSSVSSFSPSPLSSDNNNKQHASSLSVKRHSPRNLPSFQHLTPSLRTTSAPHDMLMDFFKSDEHFQEFEREFANLGRDFDVFNRLRRIEDDDENGDSNRPASRVGIEPGTSSSGSATPIPIRIDSPRGTDSSVSSGSCTPIPIHVNYRPGGGSREPTPRSELMMRTGDGSGDIQPATDEVGSFFHKDDAFSDFFNNDEDFKEFEREFANFKLKRRSRAFADDFNRRSNCDLFADLFPGYEGQPPREIRSRGSASDWDYLFNKIKRNSNIFTEPTQDLSDKDSDEESSVFLDHPNDNNRTSTDQPLPPYQENQSRTPRKSVEIAIQRRPPLPISPARRLSPEVSRSPVFKQKPLELKIEHVSSPCSSPTSSSTSSPRTPTGAPFAPRPRTDSPLLLHINEDDLRDSPSIRRVLQFDEFDENDEEPTTPTNSNQTVLHIDESSAKNNNGEDGEHIVIEHRFSEGISTPTTTITRRRKGSSSSSSSSERAASPASPLTVRHQNNPPPQQYQVPPSSEIRDRRRFTDPSRIVAERTFDDRNSEPDFSKQNRFSTALEILHDVDANKSHSIATSKHKPHDKDCQYTCHEKCRQLVTLDCKNSLPNSGSDGSIETSLSEPASTPGSNSTISDTSPNTKLMHTSINKIMDGVFLPQIKKCSTDIVSNGEPRLPLGVDIRDQPQESPFLWITKSVREQQPYADLKDLMDWWEWENLQSLYFRHINSQHTLQFTAMLRPQDETDSGYRSGPIPEEILPPKQPSQETLNREDLKRKLQEYNNNVPFANLAMGPGSGCSENMDSGCSMTSGDLGQSGDLEPQSSVNPSTVDSGHSPPSTHLAESDSDFHDDEDNNDNKNNDEDDDEESDGETFQGFIKVTLNLIRPITMSLGARPPSIYEVLTREHIVEQNTQSISFYMPRDTVKSIHVDSETTTKEVISALLKKFKILDNPRKFAMYEQELVNGKIAKLRRVVDNECPLQTCLAWGTENLQVHRLVLQENEATGDIEWSNFSLPELNNFLKVLDREKDEHINQLQYKYRMMKKVILQRLKEIRKCRNNDVSPTSPSGPMGSNGNHSPGGQTQKVT